MDRRPLRPVGDGDHRDFHVRTQHEVRTLANGDPLLDLNIAFTDDQVSKNVAEAEDSVNQLQLVSSTLPLIGLIAGLVLIVLGAFLAFAGRRTA